MHLPSLNGSGPWAPHGVVLGFGLRRIPMNFGNFGTAHEECFSCQRDMRHGPTLLEEGGSCVEAISDLCNAGLLGLIRGTRSFAHGSRLTGERLGRVLALQVPTLPRCYRWVVGFDNSHVIEVVLFFCQPCAY